VCQAGDWYQSGVRLERTWIQLMCCTLSISGSSYFRVGSGLSQDGDQRSGLGFKVRGQEIRGQEIGRQRIGDWSWSWLHCIPQGYYRKEPDFQREA
jgi:hypothetical protein